MTTVQLIIVISIVSPLFAIAAGGRTRSKSLVWWYVLSCLVFDLSMSGIKHYTNYDYKIIGHTFFVVEFSFVSAIFHRIIGLNKKAMLSVLFVWIALYAIRTNVFRQPDFIVVSLPYFCYIIYAICGFYLLMQEQRIVFLERSLRFWVLVAFIIYGSGDFLVFLFRDYLVIEDIHQYDRMWSYGFLTINTLKNLCLGIALLQTKDLSLQANPVNNKTEPR